MSEFQVIQTTLERAVKRRRLARALRGLWVGLLVGASLTLLTIAVHHLVPLPLGAVTFAGFIPLPCMALGLLVGGWRKPDLSQAARWLGVSRPTMRAKLTRYGLLPGDGAAGESSAENDVAFRSNPDENTHTTDHG